MDFRDGKTHPLYAFQTFYTYMYFYSSVIFIYTWLNVYNLICYIIQSHEANSYEKYGIGSVFKQLVNKVSLEIIILVKLYGQPEERDRKKN